MTPKTTPVMMNKHISQNVLSPIDALADKPPILREGSSQGEGKEGAVSLPI